LGLKDVEELAGAHYVDSLVAAKLPQLLVTRHEVVGFGGHGGGQDQVILGVGGNAVNLGGHRGQDCPAPEAGEKTDGLIVGNVAAKAGIRESARQLGEDTLGNNQRA